MKIRKLDSRGFSHDILVMLFVVIFAVSGVAYMVASHADTPITPPSGSWLSLGSVTISQQKQTIAAYACKFTTPANSTVWQVNGYFELTSTVNSNKWAAQITNRGTTPYPGYKSIAHWFPSNSAKRIITTFVYNNGPNNYLEFGYNYNNVLHGVISANVRGGKLPTCTAQKPVTVTHSTPSAPRPAPRPATAPSTSSFFTVKGARVYTATGKEYISYGISVIDDLNQKDWQNYAAASDAQIQASAQYWHANTIRLQVSENIIANNPTPGKDYNDAAMQRLGAEVDEIESLGKIPVINDCTIFTGNQAAPTNRTLAFWKAVTGYLNSRNSTGKYSNVIFDVFNEPQKGGIEWQNGGGGYVGMQDLVNEIRNGPYLSNNLIWVEGVRSNSWLSNLDKYPIKGSNVVFAYHHLDMNNPSSWRSAMGLDLKTKVPVVDGEWAQYAAARPECFAQGAKNTAAYLQLLRQNHIGLIAWSLEPRVLVYTNNPQPVSDTIASWFPTTAAGYSQPNHFNSKYTCTDSQAGQGAGYDVMEYFLYYSS